MSRAITKIRELIKSNIVLVVCVPGIVLFHWGWHKVQHVDIFVKEEERKEGLPIVRALKKYKEKYYDKVPDEPTKHRHH